MKLAILYILSIGAFALDNAITIRNTGAVEQTRRPFTESVWFADNEICDYPQAFVDGVATTTQADVKIRYSGSNCVRHALVSFRATVPASGSVKVDFRNQAAGNNSGYLDKASILAFKSGNWGCVIETTASAVTQGANCRTMLNAWSETEDEAGTFYWLKGAVATQLVLRSPDGTYDWGYTGAKWGYYTADPATDTFTSTGHGLANNDRVYIGDIYNAPAAPLSITTQYWIVNATTDTFQLATAQGGAAIDLTTTGNSVQGWVRKYADTTWAAAADANHKSLSPAFVLTFYPALEGGDAEYVRAEFILENTKTTAIQDQYYDVALKVGTTGGITKLQDSQWISHAFTRWRMVYWADDVAPTGWADYYGDQGVLTDHNLPYLVYAHAVLPWDMGKVEGDSAITYEYTDMTAGDWGQSRKIGRLGNARLTMGMGTTGGRGDIGPIPRWYARYLYRMDSLNAWKFLMGTFRASGNIPMHMRESEAGRDLYAGTSGLGRVLSVNARPQIWTGHTYLNDTTGSAVQMRGLAKRQSDTGLNQTGKTSFAMRFQTKDGEGNQWSLESSHWPEMAWIPYVITGDYFALEELWFQGSYMVAEVNPGCVYVVGDIVNNYRCGGVGFITNDLQVRGQAWASRTVGLAALVTPDGLPERTYFAGLLDNETMYLEGMFNIKDGSFPPSPDNNCSGWTSNGTQNNWWKWCYGFLYGGRRVLAPNPAELADYDPMHMFLGVSFIQPNPAHDNLVYDGTQPYAGWESYYTRPFFEHVAGMLSWLGYSRIDAARKAAIYPLIWMVLAPGLNPYMSQFTGVPVFRKPNPTATIAYCQTHACPFQRGEEDLIRQSYLTSWRGGCNPRDGYDWCSGNGNVVSSVDYNPALHFLTSLAYNWDVTIAGTNMTGRRAWEWGRDNLPYQDRFGSATPNCQASGGAANCDNPRWWLLPQAVSNVEVVAGDTSAVVRFTSPDGGSCKVAVQPSPFASSVDDADPVIPAGSPAREYVAAGLTPGAQHYYRITCGPARNSGTFQTLPSGGSPTTIRLSLSAPVGVSATRAVVDYGDDRNVSQGSTQPVACAPSCSTEIPGKTGRSKYYRVRFQNAGGSTVARGRVEVLIAR